MSLPRSYREKIKNMRAFIILLFIFFAHIASAQVVITEIMYDFSGTDGNGEHDWIEVTNEGGTAVDLSSYKFFEANTNHGLKISQGEATVSAGTSVVIANSLATFLADFPDFNGTLFDSSFSLNSTSAGETLSIRTPELVDEDSVTYSADWGAKDDGNSLQKISGTWKAAAPTPGEIGAASVQSTSSSSGSAAEASDASVLWQASPSVSNSAVTIEVGAKNRLALLGAPVLFEGRVLNANKEPVENTQMNWSFGDGGTEYGWGMKSVSHTYHYVGEYYVFLETPTLLATSDRIRVRVIAPQIILRTGGDATRSFLTLENRGSDELDLTGWQIIANGRNFILPKIILGTKKIVTLPSEATKLQTPEGSLVELRYGNGVRVPLVNDTASPAPAVVQALPVVATHATGAPSAGETFTIKPASVSQAPEPSVVSVAQKASALDAVGNLSSSYSLSGTENQNDHVWYWYVGIAFIAATALLGLRLVRARSTLADEFEIVEEGKEEK